MSNVHLSAFPLSSNAEIRLYEIGFLLVSRVLRVAYLRSSQFWTTAKDFLPKIVANLSTRWLHLPEKISSLKKIIPPAPDSVSRQPCVKKLSANFFTASLPRPQWMDYFFRDLNDGLCTDHMCAAPSRPHVCESKLKFAPTHIVRAAKARS